MLFISTSGVLGKYLQLSPELIIFWRSALASILLIPILKMRKFPIGFKLGKHAKVMFLGAFLMGVHWWAYFYSLQLSTVALAMLAIFTYPIITSLLEPLILKVSFQKHHILTALLTLIGIYFLVPDFSYSHNYNLALVLGIGSALAYALRNILMKKIVNEFDGMQIMYYQSVVVALISLFVPIVQSDANMEGQWWALIGLALFTTIIGHSLLLYSFKKFSISTASILSCSQPIFGIILAVIFLNEVPGVSTIIGGVFILTSIIIETRFLNN